MNKKEKGKDESLKDDELTNDVFIELAETNTNFCVVCSGTFRDFAELRLFLRKKGINVIYQTTSQGKLLVVKEGETHEEKSNKENREGSI